MDISEKNIVGELVAQDYRTAPVFQSFGIDFCCKGNRTVIEACRAGNLQTNVVVEALRRSIQQNDNPATDFNSWPLDLLADYIEKRHHRYVETKIQEIKPFLQKIVQVHGGHHPELAEIEWLFSQSAGELAMHLKKEELILFPFIRKMVRVKENGQLLPVPHFGAAENPIAMMQHEHDVEGERFRKIATLSNNYVPPVDTCNTYRITFALLKEFEEDLHLHIHLENNILFPKTIEMEKTMRCTP